MKTKISLFVPILIGFFNANYGQNSTASVNKIQGFYIFTDSQPLAEYDVVGEISTDGTNDKDIKNSGGQYQTVRDYFIRTARQTNYTADGLILTLVNGGTDKAIIIKFKENAQNKEQAKVNQYQGIYVFTDCEPVKETKYIETIINRTGFSSSQYTSIRDKLVKRCKKEFLDAKGLIIKLVAGGKDTGDVIQFE